MKTLICPISPLRINRNVVRITGFMMATMLALYAYTGNVVFVAAIVIDYFLRAFTPLAYSPFSWLAQQVADAFNLPLHHQDKAPKIFAARVGFLFALATAALYPSSMTGSLIVGATLMTFALLESVLDFCVGCLVYTYVVLPLVGPPAQISRTQEGSSEQVSSMRVTRRTLSMSIVLGTLYGATWAVTLLLVSALWGANDAGAALASEVVERATIGVWFGALAGALAGLIGGATRLKIDLDTEPWTTSALALGVAATSIAVVVVLYSLAIDNVAHWLAINAIAIVQNAPHTAARATLVTIVLLPAILALRLLMPKALNNKIMAPR